MFSATKGKKQCGGGAKVQGALVKKQCLAWQGFATAVYSRLQQTTLIRTGSITHSADQGGQSAEPCKP